MSLHLDTYSYGHTPRSPGLSVGVARHLPRGVKKDDYRRRGYFDVWLPALAPSAELVAAYRGGSISFRAFASRYRAAMNSADAKLLIRLLAATARAVPVRLGCFCEDERRCHRSILRELVVKAAAALPPEEPATDGARLASPPCLMPEIDES
jgi:uncharacterized protein YeaO (DUF488 family)